MDQDRSLSIETKRIKVGTTFDFDLTDKFGRVVLKAGRTFDEAIRTRMLAAGVETVTISVMPNQQNKTHLLLDSYPLESVGALQNMLAQTEQGLQAFVEETLRSRRTESDILRNQLDRFLGGVADNSATALGVLAARWSSDPQQPDASRLIARSTRLAWLAMITGVEMELNPSELVSLGLAGLLHDCALFVHPEWRDPVFRSERREEFVAAYQRHPVESVEMLNSTAGLGQNVLYMVAQLHEQSNGSGFPRGLRSSQILPAARILNVVDAYLEIVDPTFRKNGIVPADALAQICFHAVLGVFDREAVRCFVDSVSAYPVGSEVDLDDSRRAIVVRSNPGKPLEPVVRLLDGPNEVTDLLNAKLRIDAPTPGGPGLRRLQREKEMSIPFWDATALLDPEE
jgi:HD-GYP domain-containing protein (c-di-GMP phosphodiesterase class II)